MALMKAKTIPKDAVTLDELEATNYAWDIVNNWNNKLDIWALRYGPVILGACSAIGGVIINRQYRMKLKIGHYGYLSSVIPISVMPGMLTVIYHRQIISTDLLLLKNEGCPICYEMRASALQIGLGVIYPMILGPTSAMMFANRYSTYRVPDLFEGPRVIFKFLSKITKPFMGTIATIAVLQFVTSNVITYFEMKNNFTIRKKISAIEKKIMAEQGLDF
ncbi:uncharacterized protein LOC114248754 [Bombyx mandarina]|uniref:Transmembrane protein 126A n=2 Tax=Bombyx TaxID=7090 RepID=A0A8R1WFV7_BOMMO|nr:uncharacterized protein LOC101741382 [Bombyx mori]XP_028037966.1 uncharacterized protein LOC114248754 [Bombyx mandarina]